MYAYNKYEESKKTLRMVAGYNGKPEEKLERFDKMRYDIQVLDDMMEKKGGSESAKTQKS